MKNCFIYKTLDHIAEMLLCGGKKGGQGYGVDIRDAEVFTESEVNKICTHDKDYRPYEKDYIDNLTQAHKLIIDMQFLRKKVAK